MAVAGWGPRVAEAWGGVVGMGGAGHGGVAVGEHGGEDCGAVVREAHLGATVVAQRVEDDRLAFGGHAPDMLLDIYHLIQRV